jgi:hypothetical protein
LAHPVRAILRGLVNFGSVLAYERGGHRELNPGAPQSHHFDLAHRFSQGVFLTARLVAVLVVDRPSVWFRRLQKVRV